MFALAGQPNQPQGNEQRNDWASVLHLVAVVHSTCIIVFLRRGFGRQALGPRGLASLVLLLFCMAADPLMAWWAVAFLVAIIVQRIITQRAINNGAVVHSLYAGTPLLMKVPFFRTEGAAKILEMIVCFTVGAFMLAVSQFVGGFIMLGMITLMLRTGIEEMVFNKRLERMQDARLEGKWYGGQMR